jgi:prepilin-type N-terminal cleavage/methylation domain-containing protein
MKMKPRIRVKAFTIMEVLIAMAISSIVIMASMKVYLLFGDLVRLKNKNMACGSKTIQLYQVLTSDVNRAMRIDSKDNDLVLTLPGMKIITYEFETTYALRTVASGADTFWMEFSDFTINREPVTGLVNSIAMEARTCNDTIQLNLYKKYTNDGLMNTSVMQTYQKDDLH